MGELFTPTAGNSSPSTLKLRPEIRMKDWPWDLIKISYMQFFEVYSHLDVRFPVTSSGGASGAG